MAKTKADVARLTLTWYVTRITEFCSLADKLDGVENIVADGNTPCVFVPPKRDEAVWLRGGWKCAS